MQGGGRKPLLTLEEESNVINWIKQNRELKIAINTYSLLLYIQKIKPDITSSKEHAKIQLVYRFLKRNGFVLRKACHIGQPLPRNYEDLFLMFQKKIILAKKMLDINENSFDRLINIDETPIYMDMPETKTIDFKGKKGIDIYTFGADKVRISAILSIVGNGNKLPPILVFKAKKNGRLENELNTLPIVRDKKIFVYCQENAWCNTDIFLNWFKKIYLNYELFKIKKKCLLILDKAPSHCTNTILEFLNDNKIKRVFIPGGLTSKLQPLDLLVNNPFKEKLKKKI